ncbi:MAG: tRNA glutamyl-Q(34) synthetase GluQRS [Phycisphaera sp.]|nr:MAG: tRNA glutamyl-Q(34) synthetase GluQRS [Phycisphaera sp.]
MENQKTRLAPSPTGALHLGNALTFVVNWALARQRGWEVVLRIEDLDTPRVKPGVVEQTIETLRWLGLDWDTQQPLQSSDLSPYIDAMRTLASRRSVYPCSLTRSEIAEAAGAPHEGEIRFDPSLRPGDIPTLFDDTETNWRLIVPDEDIEINEHFADVISSNPGQSVGDFVVWTQREQPSYQLAVTVDDARQGITHIVRGNDLIDSAARQALLRRAIGIEPEPHHFHTPLVRGSDGRRLAKRHGDTRIDTYRDKGVQPERILALLARWAGIPQNPGSLSIQAFTEAFRVDTMPRGDLTFTPEDDRWLLQRAPHSR